MKISNEFLSVEVSEHGAELVSVYSNVSKQELLYQKDGTWPCQDHVLFPIIGPAKGYLCEGKEYSCPSQHGFARDSEFVSVLNDATTMSFSLNSNEATLSYYPYEFSLTVVYHLQGNALKRSYMLINKSKSPMPTMLGSHAAYKANFGKAKIILPKETLKYYPRPNMMLEIEETPFPYTGEWVLAKEDFKKFDTVVLLNSHKPLVLENGLGERIGFHFHSPYIAIWSPISDKDQFVCVEPWWGLPVYKDMPLELKERKAINLVGGSLLLEETVSYSGEKKQ